MRIALTGGIACGKSLVARFLNELGVETLDADDIVHDLIPADERRRLAKTVFADPVARKALEERIHPLVRARLDAWLDEPSAALRVAVVPLLFEVGWGASFDVVVCLSSSRENQVRRMVETRGYSVVEAESRIAAQMPVAEKAARSRFVLPNDGTVDELRTRVVALVASLNSL